MQYTVRPISERTAFRGEPIHSRFTVTWSQCVDLLERELDFLDAHDLVFEVDVDERAIRIDGQLLADAKVHSNAVRVAFESNVGPLTYATDEFVRSPWQRGGMREDWRHNVYAIAKSLEALRMVDRYGVTKRGEQYAGFKQLGSGRAMPASHMTSDQARAVLVTAAGRDHPHGLQDVDLWKLARVRAHPDRHDGDRTAWDQVEQAAAVLGVLV